MKVIIAGWSPGQCRRGGRVGSLIPGLHTDAGLTNIGYVGSGFTDQVPRPAAATVNSSTWNNPAPPSRAGSARDRPHAHWVRPQLVSDVGYRAWTPDHRLRHPAWKGLRLDRAATEVTLPDMTRRNAR